MKIKDKVIAIIPVSGSDPEFRDGTIPRLGSRNILDWTFRQAKASGSVERIIVSTDSELIADYAKRKGVEVPFIRSTKTRSIPLVEVYRNMLEFLEKKENYYCDWIVQLWFTYPFRMNGVIDDAIRTTISSKVDSSFLAYPEYKAYWYQPENMPPQRIETNLNLLREHRPPIYRELQGLFSMSRRYLIKQGKLFSDNVGIIPIRDFGCTINLHDYQERMLSRLVAKNFDPGKPGLNNKDAKNIINSMVNEPKMPKRRTIIACRSIRKGELIRKDSVKSGFSANGISSYLLPRIAGRYKAIYDIEPGEPITFGIIA